MSINFYKYPGEHKVERLLTSFKQSFIYVCSKSFNFTLERYKSHSGFDLHFFDNEWCWASFHVFVSHLYVFLKKCLFSFLAHFLIGWFIFLELSCRSCLYIFEISCLSVASFAILFSHSEGCLFTLLIVSFVVQKLLIRFHVFIFTFISITLGGGS